MQVKMDPNPKDPKMFKIALFGEGGVGKSTLLAAKCYKSFNATSKMTIGIDFGCVPFEDDPEKPSLLLTFDLGGQERFQFIHDSYIAGIKGAIILYDLTRFKSFDCIDKWNSLIIGENPEIPIILVGAKKDLVDSTVIDQYRQNFEAMRADLPNSVNYIEHMFVSSKNYDGIEEVFTKLHEVLIS
ncbi:MAG: Rab family GTPase [Promethearchaeota archaeon]